jgi:Ca2+-transporting ATPase
MHQQSVEQAMAILGTSARGLDELEIERRRATHGANVLDEAPPRSVLALLLAQFTDFMILVLIAAAIVSGIIGDLTDTVVIVVIVLLNAAIGFLQEYRAERALSALRAMAAPSATVVREGRTLTVPSRELVPGDAVVIEPGRIVPADLRLIESAGLRIDEAALTGESVPVDKHTAALDSVGVAERRNIAHKGTHVTHGRGLGVVFATGMRTEFGRIARLLERSETVETPLQRRLAQFGRRLSFVVLTICAVVFVAGLLRGEAALPMLLTALSLAVAAIPEALPAVVSISLALGARRLVARHALVRRLPVVEALGSVTVIASDKTGTLTANAMRVVRYWVTGRFHEAVPDRAPPEPWPLLLRTMAISHDATLEEGGRAVGDPTETALIVAAQSQGVDPLRLRDELRRIGEISFDSERKRMTTFHSLPEGGWLSITKGAGEVVLPACRVSDPDVALAAADAMARDGLRVLAVAVRRWDRSPADLAPGEVESELELLGLLGLLDPPRPEAIVAIRACHDAGIKPVMITGDHPLTAAAVAERLGLPTSAGALATGADVAAMSPETLRDRAGSIRVYARVAPEQKLAIVMALQERGEIVAMTGDGVNDAPALRRADIGVAMGITGTDVAREAAGMVLLDDDFATIVAAVREGRRIYDNLRRFVRYVLTTNSGEIWTIFLAPFLGLPVPLLPIQILWVNLVTDGMPGLALAAEPAELNHMNRPPRSPRESLFAGGLGWHALLVGLLMAGLTIGTQAFYVGRGDGDWQTVVFTMMCFTQIGHVVAIRSESAPIWRLGILSNRPLLFAVGMTILLQLAVVYTPIGNAWFRTVPLGAAELALCVGAALVILLVVEVEKAVRRRRAQATP